MKKHCSFAGMLLLYITTTFPVISQTEIMDALKHQLIEAESDSARLEILLSLAFYAVDFPEEANGCHAQIRSLVEKIPNSELKIRGYNQLGINLQEKNVSEALLYYNKALGLAAKLPAKSDYMKAETLTAMSWIYSSNGDFDHALECCLEAISILELYNSKSNTLMVAYEEVAGIYSLLNQKEKARFFRMKSLEQAERLNDSFSLANAYISYVYSNAAEDPQKSINYLEKAMKIGVENNFTDIISYTYDAYAYYEEVVSKDTLKSINYLLKEIQYLREKKMAGLEANAIKNLCELYEVIDPVKGIEYAKRGLLISDSLKRNLNAQAFNKYLGDVYAMQEKYKDAFFYYKAFLDLYVELFNEKSRQQINFLSARYEAAEREAKIKEMENLEIIRQQHLKLHDTLLVGSVVIIILILVGLLLYRRYMNQKEVVATERIKKLEQEKQLVAMQAVLDGETAERTRLARDLHDGLGSMLSVVKLNIPEMKHGVTLDSDNVEQFKRAMSMLDESILELRRVAHHMMPESLMRYGLKTSLTDFCSAIPSVSFHYFGDDRKLESKLEILIYRSAYELVNNALKHAEASQINVQLVQESDRVSFTVQDNGKGFDPESTKMGMGLENIRNRVETYNGKMTIYSLNGNGTEINIEFQL